MGRSKLRAARSATEVLLSRQARRKLRVAARTAAEVPALEVTWCPEPANAAGRLRVVRGGSMTHGVERGARAYLPGWCSRCCAGRDKCCEGDGKREFHALVRSTREGALGSAPLLVISKGKIFSLHPEVRDARRLPDKGELIIGMPRRQSTQQCRRLPTVPGCAYRLGRARPAPPLWGLAD